MEIIGFQIKIGNSIVCKNNETGLGLFVCKNLKD